MPVLRWDRSVTYRGWRSVDGPNVIRIDEDGTETRLAWRPGLILSRVEFDWGIDSPGADQLAFAILADAFGEDNAKSLYVDFKFDVVIDLDTEWVFSVSDVAEWLHDYSEE